MDLHFALRKPSLRLLNALMDATGRTNKEGPLFGQPSNTVIMSDGSTKATGPGATRVTVRLELILPSLYRNPISGKVHQVYEGGIAAALNKVARLTVEDE